MVNVSIIVGCFGNAPIMSNFCTRAAAFAPLPADELVAGESGDGATEVSVLVWLWGADSVLDWEVWASCVSVGCVVSGTDTTGAGAGVTGTETTDVAFSGLIGLTGLSTLVGFVTDFTHASKVVVQDVKDKLPYGSGHVPVLVCVMDPVYPAGQLSVCVSTVGVHVAGSHLQVS